MIYDEATGTYKSKPKGAPSFSGRRQSHMHQCLAPYQKGGHLKVGQQKQKGKK